MERVGIGSMDLFGTGKSTCGSQGYERVFTGTVGSVVDLSGTDKLIQLIPDEIFLGEPATEVTAFADQACLPQHVPEIKAGDKWLFYLQDYDSFHNRLGYQTSDELELSFYSPSKPIVQADDDIQVLRHLARLTKNSAIVTGKVERIGENSDNPHPTPVANLEVVAQSQHNGTEFSGLTDDRGHFEFEVPADYYEVSANIKPGLKELEIPFLRAANLRVQKCVDFDFTLLTDGKLAGKVSTPKGKPARYVQVAIVPVSPVRPPFTVITDENGHFEVSGRQPGQYLVGVGLLAPFGSAAWRSRIYYPGVAAREQAKVIELGDGEWQSDINFKLPNATELRQVGSH